MITLKRAAGRLLRRLRQARHGWSPARDRAFHDDLFRTQDFNPFTPSYPGYITIRRFTDQAEAELRDARRVLDLGCGPGEITCELARRCPDITMVGVDHSEAAIGRARAHAAALQLGNVNFICADVERFEPDGRVDLVAMFDAFHHLVDPAGFVNRVAGHTDRFLLIEPRGNWHGGWQKDLQFDWLVGEMEKLRHRLSTLTREPPAATQSGPIGGAVTADPPTLGAGLGAGFPEALSQVSSGGVAQHAGEPVEQRYTIDELEGFFSGFGLRVHGTVAGIESYPPDPYRTSPWRDRLGTLTYELFAEIDRTLRERDLDLLAKHWVIVAERGLTHARRGPPAPNADAPGERLAGAFDVQYADAKGPMKMIAGERYSVAVTVHNRGWRTWSSAAAHPIMLSYHWLDANSEMAILDGRRTPLAGRIEAGDIRRSALSVDAPANPGHYRLAIDLVEEGVCWFSEAGSPWLEMPVRVQKRV